MKMISRFSFVVALVAVALTGCNAWPSRDTGAYPPASVDMSLKQVSPHVYYVQGAAGVATDNHGFISNAAVVITDEGVLVFDVLGTPSLAQLLLEKIRAVTDKPVKKVFVSHYHADHIYGLQVFKDLGAEIYGPAGAADYLVSEIAANRLRERRTSLAPWVGETTHLVAPDHSIDRNIAFRFGGLDFEVTSFGSAHSQGDLSLYVVQDKVLLSGDLVFAGRIPFVGGNDVDNWIASLEKLERTAAAVVIPGHGAAFTNSAEGTRLTRSYLALLRNEMAVAVENLTPFDEAYNAVDWTPYEHLPAFRGANRRNAYRVYLALEAKFLGG